MSATSTTMEFLSPAQHLCYDKIAPWVPELFGDQAQAHNDLPLFGVSIGSAFAVIQVAPWKEDARITIRAYISTGTELTPELLTYLLRQNDTLPFGAFGVDEAGDIFFQHAAVGSTCDRAELHALVLAVVTTADEYDDQIVNDWGGEIALNYAW